MKKEHELLMDASVFPGKGKNRRRAIWSIVIVAFLVSVSFSVTTARNYTEIVKAKSLAYHVTTDDTTLNLNPNGSLESVQMSLHFNIINPSKKELRLWILTFKAWVRDLPFEDGVDTTRWRVDGKILVNGTYQSYYPVFVAAWSFDNPEIYIPAESNITVTRNLELNRTRHPDIMAEFEAIYGYGTQNDFELQWMQYTSSIIFIEGIPQYSGPNKDANVIRRYEGLDITPGEGGAGP